MILLLIIGIVVLLLIKPKFPEIISFSADPNNIEVGQSATLSWSIKNALSVEILIDQNIVSVESGGNRQVQPVQTTEYKLIAKGKKGEEITKSLIVDVKDIKPPKLAMALSPSEPTSAENIIFTATATDPGGIRKIEIMVNGTKTEECPNSPCIYKGGPYPLENIDYEVYAWDKSGNKAIIGPESIALKDAIAPDLTVGHSPSIPNTGEKITFTASASDPGGISKVQLFVNGTKVEECTGSPCKYTGGPYPLGSVSYEAHAWDKSNNKMVAGPKSFMPRDIDPPNVAITYSPKDPTPSDKVIFTTSVSDPSDLNKVEILINSKKVEPDPAPRLGSLTVAKGASMWRWIPARQVLKKHLST